MKKRVAVTGAGGFVGLRLISGLAQSGWDVYAITSHPERIAANAHTTVVECDWSEEGIEEAVIQSRSADLWVHTAARVGFGDQDPLPLYHDNALLTEQLARMLFQLDLQTRLIYLSSISVYGGDQELATDLEPQPQTHYGLSKLLGERFCLAYLGDRCLVYRLAGVWGKEENPKLFINRCLQHAEKGYPLTVAGDGQAKRNYLWVGDVTSLVVCAFEKGWHGIQLIAGQEAVSIRDMVLAVANRFSVRVNFQDNTTVTADEPDFIVPMSARIKTTPFFEALQVELGRNA
jgi:nucleoside-diphosphate-sugar epimerase